MLREINLDEISDGRLYSSNDMAKTDCKGCDGCSACCHGMGNSIVLDPLDVYRLSTNLSKSVNELLTGPLELNVVDGIILPNLKTYEKYIADWHFFLKDLQEYVMNLASDSSSNSDETARTISMHVLTQFYLTPYSNDGDFYHEFYERLEKSRLFTQSIGI